VEVPGRAPEDLIALGTVADPVGTGTMEQTITWLAGGKKMTQHIPRDPSPLIARDGRGSLMERFDGVDSSVISGVQQTQDGKRELGIVYDATAYGSGSPTAHFVLLRLEGDAWQIVWDVQQSASWRGSHGRIEFPNGDLSELVVRSDDFSEGSDALSAVIFEANAGPHRAFVDTWARLGNGYTLASAVTVPSAYATLVEFLYALGTGGDATARALVTDAALVDEARREGLGGWAGKNWGIACPVGDCGVQAGPIGFDPQRYHGAERGHLVRRTTSSVVDQRYQEQPDAVIEARGTV
jgi:hypothetical protein